MLTQTPRITAITALLRQAGQAHHHYEQTVLKGVYDQDWPDWYARYALDQGLAVYLQQSPTVEALREVLNVSYQAYQATHSRQPWADYTAQHLLATYGEAP